MSATLVVENLSKGRLGRMSKKISTIHIEDALTSNSFSESSTVEQVSYHHAGTLRLVDLDRHNDIQVSFDEREAEVL